ncbi:uncharacterized protein J7T54_003591 [Emericellopsis cladophorae]|uniref:Deoxyribose-phosphate aldolase n=1 Tax=Emericellopsis cladophorae TaxID=2686198 RepID=A0A9P9Y439_9HYPO|nr:uncharacterized protein J7T54_003591 [Emericellopsis cladophorae]KAI6782579.1 hypothetical protein J7T54_003591 [Emericellopsis cladophorae]
MSFHERNAKKRKIGHNGRANPSQDRSSFKPSAIFNPLEGGRDWTISVAVPSSVLANLVTADQRLTLPGRIARALAVFSVDEVIIFDDSPPASRLRNVDPNSYTGDTDPCHFIAHILSYIEAPPFMRKTLFPLHPNLQKTALLPSLDMPHHPNPKEWIQYREGVTVAGRAQNGGTLVEVGLEEPVEIAEQIPPKTRVTLQFPEDENAAPQCIHPEAPRTEGGYYWGYQVRKCASLSAIFEESPFEDGYDLSIGTSERGEPASKVFPAGKRVAPFKHLLVVFGGPRGLEYASMNDDKLKGMGVQGAKTKELFDHWVNILPNQGSRTIRTEEALLIGLTTLRGIWDSS